MKATIGGIRYDTDYCLKLASFDHYNNCNTYSGTTYLLEAGNGELLVWTESNGQDCHLFGCLTSWSDWEDCTRNIDVFEKVIDEERLKELGLLKTCPAHIKCCSLP
jgi:hypothetical protein